MNESKSSNSAENPEDTPQPVRRKVRRKRRVPSSRPSSDTAKKKSGERTKRKSSSGKSGKNRSRKSKSSGLITTLRSKLTDSTRAARRDRRRHTKRFLLITCAMIICGSAAFIPLMSADYIWPDRALVRDNPLVESAAGFYNAWTLTSETTSYRPLAWNTFWLQRRMWGSKAYGFHLTSAFLHVLNAFLLWRVLKRSRLSFGWFAGILAALHPGAVFAIGWVSMQPVLLATAFAQMTLLAFLNFERNLRQDWQLVAVTTMVLATLAHPMIGMATPFCCLAVAWWYRGPQNGIEQRHLNRCLPMFVIAVVALSLHLTLYFLNVPGAGLPTMGRIFAAPRILGLLFAQAIFPLGQTLAYALPKTGGLVGGLVGMLVIIAAFATGLWTLFRHRQSKACAMLFVVGSIMLALALPFVLFPASHITTTTGLVPDAWKYPMILAFIPVPVMLFVQIMHNHQQISRRVTGSALLALLIALAVISWRQSGRVDDRIGIWSRVIEQCRGCWIAHQQLGWEYLRTEHYDQSIPHFEQAIKSNGESAHSFHGLGIAQWKNGFLNEARDSLVAATELDPQNKDARNILAKVQDTLAERDFTIPDFLNLDKVSEIDDRGYTDLLRYDYGLIREDPLFTDGKLSLASMSIERQRWDEAASYIRELLQQHPDNAIAHYMQGFILYRKGQIGQATQELNTAIDFNPSIAGAHYLLAEIALLRDDTQQALEHFEKTVQIAPGMDDAYYKIGVIYARHNDTKEALRYFTSTVRINSRHVDGLNALARLLGSSRERRFRNGRQAVTLAERATLIDSKNPVLFDTLAIAYAEAGMFSDAINMTAKGVELAMQRGWDELADNMRRRAEFYKQEKKYREDTQNLLFTR